MMQRRLKELLRPLSRTPLHPQWLANRPNPELGAWLREIPAGSTVLDVGSATQWPRDVIPPSATYWSMDYPATSAWYGTRPHVFGDAGALPVRDASVDVVLLLDVLEHLPDPEQALARIHAALKPGGRLILKVPFLYPVHDAPHDYTRWTACGHRALAERLGFAIRHESYLGEPLATAGLLGNLALAHSALRAIERRSPAALLVPLVPLGILAMNVASALLARLFGRSGFMPYAHQAVWIRQDAPPARN